MARFDPKSTGGGGFDFEDKIGAYFLSYLLVGKNPFPTLELSRLIKIKFQRGIDGWEFDDIILIFLVGGLEKQIAISVKSNSQITANKFPTEIIEQIWQQHCSKENNPFKSRHDYLCIITSGASTDAIESYRKLRNFASKHKGEDLDIHIKKPEFTNQRVRNLYKSFDKPTSINCNQNIGKTEVIERLIHFDMNLDDPTSSHLKEAFDNLDSSLLEGVSNDLWIKLQYMTKESRTVSGEIDFSGLIEGTKSSFQIRGHHDLDSDLAKLKQLLDTEKEKIKSTIGSSIFIKREINFFDQFEKDKINVFIGESGSGKSVLMKQWAYELDKTIIWLPYTIFKARTLSEINTLLNLKNDLFDIIHYGPSEQVIIIDAIDRITTIEERELLKSFLIKFQMTSGKQHYCVLSSQDQIWSTLVGNISNHKFVFNVVPAPIFENNEFKIVAEKNPNLAAILNSDATKQILKNPKYLDLAVQMAEKSSLDTNKSINEPVLIRGFWELLSDGGVNKKQVLLTRLAIDQADQNNFLSPIQDMPSSETETIEYLVRDGILKVQDGHVRFSHDLYGDWIRQRFLITKRTNVIREILKRKNNVYWQHSIRLTSLEILETDGFDSWKKEVESLHESGDDVLVDLFLDIAITSSNQRDILESIKEFLFSDSFQVLHRFLERFLAYATIPNPQIMSMCEKFDLDEISAAQFNRVPLFSYWPSLLLFLVNNFENTRSGRFQMSQIAEKWLLFTPMNFPSRKEAAILAFKVAEWVFERKFKEPYSYIEGDEKKCYQALLAAFPELPVEIEDLCLKLIGLREVVVERPALEVTQKKLKSIPVANTSIMTRRKIEKKVLPHGPQFKKDRIFKDVCLSGQNFKYLVDAKPILASQVLLAAIIDEPQEYEDLYDNGLRLNESLGTDYTQEFYSPLYTKGPFLNFFRAAPEEALNTLIDLVSLVTDQWSEREKKCDNEPFSIEIKFGDKKKRWIGDGQVFLWAMNMAHCPDVIVAFLMALEKWFYEKIDANEDIEIWIDQIIEKSNSLALIGILNSIGKYSPKLFLDKLKPLLVCPNLIWWDQQYLLQSSGATSMIPWSGEDQYIINIALKWFEMKHRKTSLKQWALNFLLNIPDMKPFFKASREEWEKGLNGELDSQLEAIICKFNPDNYSVVKLTDGDRNVEL